jgi:uncharacterized protein YjbI with pentapeptide repeats
LDKDTIALWHELTVTAGVVAGAIGFFRGLEQRKQAAFADVMLRLCDDQSAVLRAAAARQLPSFHRYKPWIFLGRKPYQSQALELAVDALKVDQQRFVRQALAEALTRMLPAVPAGFPRVRLDHACLDGLTMMGYNFDEVELTKASIQESGLAEASFVGAGLWKTQLMKSNLYRADFTKARLWDADLSETNLKEARLLTADVNPQTNFARANLDGALVSAEVWALCKQQGCTGTPIQAQ